MHPPAGRPCRGAALAAVGVTAASLAVVGLATVASAAAPTTPYISESHYDTAGADTGEFVEVTIPSGADPAGLAVVGYDGNGGGTYGTAMPVPAAAGMADAPVAVAVDAPGLQNGSPDGLALVQGGRVLEFLSYEGVLTATGGPAVGTASTDIGVREDGLPAGQSLSRLLEPRTGELVWQAPAANSRGAVGPSTSPPPADVCTTPATHPVGAVQGSGAATPLAGQQVTVRGPSWPTSRGRAASAASTCRRPVTAIPPRPTASSSPVPPPSHPVTRWCHRDAGGALRPDADHRAHRRGRLC